MTITRADLNFLNTLTRYTLRTGADGKARISVPTTDSALAATHALNEHGFEVWPTRSDRCMIIVRTSGPIKMSHYVNNSWQDGLELRHVRYYADTETARAALVDWVPVRDIDTLISNGRFESDNVLTYTNDSPYPDRYHTGDTSHDVYILESADDNGAFPDVDRAETVDPGQDGHTGQHGNITCRRCAAYRDRYGWENTNENDTPDSVYELSDGRIFHRAADGSKGYGVWRLFTAPPADTQTLRTVSVGSGHRYNLGQCTEHGYLRPIAWLATETSDTAPTPYPVGTRVRILVGAHYGHTGRIITVRPDNRYTVADDVTGEVLPYAHTELDATETITQDDAGHIWHDYRESADYRSGPTTHGEYRANRNAAVRAALVNSGVRHPSALQVANVSANVLGPDATDVERVIGLIAASGDVPVHAVGSAWVTTTDGEMILNVREGISSLHVITMRDTLTAHGWHTIPLTGRANYAYRLTRNDASEQDAARTDTPESGATDCACCGVHIMASNIRVPNYCDECTAHGGENCPGSGAGIVFETAWHCPGGVCDGSGCVGDEHMPRPDDGGSNGTDDNGPESDAPARTDQGPTDGSDAAGTDVTEDRGDVDAWVQGDRCATVGHSAKHGNVTILVQYGDGSWGNNAVCDRCARYYVQYSGRVPEYTQAVIIPDDRVTVNVGYVPGMTISVWPVENVPAMVYNTFPHNTPARTRYGYMVEYADEILYAGVDVTLSATDHPAHAAFNVATRIVTKAEHADANDYGDREEQCTDHNTPYAQCSAYRDVYAHAESLSMWREDWAGTHGNVWDDMGYVGHFEAVMHDNHACLIRFGEFNGITAEEMIAQFLDLVGNGNDFEGPLGDARWHGYLTWAKIIGADQGKVAAGWIDITTTDTANKIISGMDDDDDPEVMDAYTPRVPNGEYGDDYSLAQLCAELGLTEDDESDDGALWTAYTDAFSNAGVAEVVSRARKYLDYLD